MKKIFSVLISFYLIQSILCECYKENPSGVGECESAKTDSVYCCFVEFRTNKDANYKKVCIPVKEDDIEEGKFEETMGVIELGNYTGSEWNNTILQNFRDYASIDNFDCKGNYLTSIMSLFSLILLFF